MSLSFPCVSVTRLSWGTGWVTGRDDRRQCSGQVLMQGWTESLETLLSGGGGQMWFIHHLSSLVGPPPFFFSFPQFQTPMRPHPPPSPLLFWHPQQHRMMINGDKDEEFFQNTYGCFKLSWFRTRFAMKNADVNQYFWSFYRSTTPTELGYFSSSVHKPNYTQFFPVYSSEHSDEGWNIILQHVSRHFQNILVKLRLVNFVWRPMRVLPFCVWVFNIGCGMSSVAQVGAFPKFEKIAPMMLWWCS